ncbi:MAG: hypothetical protein IKJ77_06360 [Firmicutes bacterium]|nr:hypothetical protein [Bacillota bacterium]
MKYKVKVGPKLYEMGLKELNNLLKVASEQIPLGVYAVQKGNYVELCRDKCNSITELKKHKRAYKSNGFKVYANKG